MFIFIKKRFGQECKFVKDQSGDEQTSPVNNSILQGINNGFSLHFNNSINHDQNFSSHTKGVLNSNLSNNSNGFQLKKKLQSSNLKQISSKNNLDSTDDPESSNKINTKTSMINSRQQISHFEDQQALDSLKETSSFSLNFLNNKQFGGFQTNFLGMQTNNRNGKKELINENSLNYLTSSQFLNNSGNLINNLNSTNSQQASSILQALQLNQPDFSSPTYTQQSFNNFDISKNFTNNQNSNSNINQIGLNTNKTQKLGISNNQKLNFPTTQLKTPQQNLINNQEDFDGPFDNESLSVLWGNQPEKHNLTKQPLQINQQNILINGGLKQLLNKSLLGESSFHKKNTSLNESAITPSTMSQLNSNINLNNINMNFQDDDDKGERSSRGLRNLSLKVKQIVVQKGETSYKEVAEELVNELRNSTQGQLKPEEIQKDEQNIKRRVYDALNVLIASNVIEKKWKVVKACERSHLNGRCLQADNWKNVKQIEADRDKKKQNLIQKQKTLTEYAAKYLALMNLIERNKRAETDRFNNQSSQQSVDFLNNLEQIQELSQRLNTIKESTSLKDKLLIETNDHLTHQSQQQSLSQVPNNVFKFPLILINVHQSSDQQKIIMKMSRDQKNCKVFSQSKMVISADLDVLIQMKMHKVDQKFATKYLQQEFISKYFALNNLYEPQNEVEDLGCKKKTNSERSIQANELECIEQQNGFQKNEQQSKQKQEFTNQNQTEIEQTTIFPYQTKKAKLNPQVNKKQPKEKQTKVQKSSKHQNNNEQDFNIEIELE